MVETRINSCKRKFCLRDDGPSSLEVSASLGMPLGQVVFDYSHAEVRRILGLQSLENIPCSFNPLEESRSDSNPPIRTETETLKANVHEDILELGQGLLEKYKLEIQKKAAKNLQCHMKDVFRMYQAKKHEENDLNIRELHNHYEAYIKAVQCELEEKLENEWKKVIAKLTKRMEKCSSYERMKQRREFLKIMRSEIRYTITQLYADFEQHFRAERERMIADFNEIMRKQHTKLSNTMRSLEEKHAQKARIQRQELKMQNTADIIHLLCSERSQGGTKEQAINRASEKDVCQLEKTITTLNETLSARNTELMKLKEEKEIIEKRFTKCSEELRRLVCFVFHTTPDNTEYLFPPKENSTMD